MKTLAMLSPEMGSRHEKNVVPMAPRSEARLMFMHRDIIKPTPSKRLTDVIADIEVGLQNATGAGGGTDIAAGPK